MATGGPRECAGGAVGNLSAGAAGGGSCGGDCGRDRGLGSSAGGVSGFRGPVLRALAGGGRLAGVLSESLLARRERTVVASRGGGLLGGCLFDSLLRRDLAGLGGGCSLGVQLACDMPKVAVAGGAIGGPGGAGGLCSFVPWATGLADGADVDAGSYLGVDVRVSARRVSLPDFGPGDCGRRALFFARWRSAFEVPR